MAHGCQARESQRQDDSASQDTPSKLWLKLDPKVKLRRFGSFTPSKRWLKPGIFTSRGCRWMCIYNMILARLNCIYNSRSPSKMPVINLTKVSETASNYQCIRVAPAKGQSLKIWDDSSIDALIEAFTQVQTLQTAWKSHRCQALIEVLRVNLNRLSGEDQTFGCWVEAFLQPFMQHHHAKTARRQQSYCTCGVLVLIKLLYMRVEKRLAWSRRHCPCPSPVALLSMQSWPSRYIGSCITVFSNTAQNPGCTTNNTCISAALPS